MQRGHEIGSEERWIFKLMIDEQSSKQQWFNYGFCTYLLMSHRAVGVISVLCMGHQNADMKQMDYQIFL